MNRPPAHPRKSIALAFFAFSVWAWGDAIVKYIGPRVPLYTIVFYDMVIIMAFLTGLGLWGRLGTLRESVFSPHWRWHIVRGVIIFVQFLAGMYGFTHLSLARTYTLLFSMPLLTAPLAFVFMKERIEGKKWLAIALGFAGVLIVLRPGLIPLDLASAVTLLSAVTFSASNLIARHVGRMGDERPLAFSFLPELVCLICTVPFYLIHFTMPGLHEMFWIVMMGLVSGTGFLCLSLAFAGAPAATVAPFHYSQMLWALAFGYALFGDVPDKWVAAGASIIIASGLWLIRQEGKLAADPLPDTIIVPAPGE